MRGLGVEPGPTRLTALAQCRSEHDVEYQWVGTSCMGTASQVSKAPHVSKAPQVRQLS